MIKQQQKPYLLELRGLLAALWTSAAVVMQPWLPPFFLDERNTLGKGLRRGSSFVPPNEGGKKNNPAHLLELRSVLAALWTSTSRSGWPC